MSAEVHDLWHGCGARSSTKDWTRLTSDERRQAKFFLAKSIPVRGERFRNGDDGGESYAATACGSAVRSRCSYSSKLGMFTCAPFA